MGYPYRSLRTASKGRFMTENEKNEALKDVVDLGKRLKESIDTGLYLIPRQHPAIGAIIKVANLTKDMIVSYGPDARFEKVAREMSKFRGSMDKMVDRMADNFTVTKAYYTDNAFWNDVPLQTAILFQYMADVKTDPKSEESMKEFVEQYKKSDPVDLARRMLHQFTREVRNPLMYAMEADPQISKDTLKAWHDIVLSVFYQIRDIEIEASIWYHGEDVTEAPVTGNGADTKFVGRVKLIQDVIYQFRKEFATLNESLEEPYWPKKVQEVVEKVVVEDSKATIEGKAMRIAEELGKIHTSAQFYVVVFPSSWEFAEFEMLPAQFLFVTKGGFNVAVYRSLEAHMRKNVDIVCSGVYRFGRGDHPLSLGYRYDFISNEEIELWAALGGTFESCGLLFAVRTDQGDVGLAWTKPEVHANGPGAFTNGKMEYYDWHQLTHYSFFLLAGYM